MTFDPLPDDVAEALARADPSLGPFGRLLFRTETGSTNDLALTLAAAGEPEGTAVMAERQHAGRGRRGREWFSPPESGLYLSVIVRPPARAAALTLVTLGAGVAVARAIEWACGVSPELKWPNDIVVGRPWRKLGGVLSEAASIGARLEGIVIGVGLNLRARRWPSHLVDRATALETELGRSVDRSALVVALLRETARLMDTLHAGDVMEISHAWRRYGSAGLRGSVVEWREDGRRRRGRTRDIDPDGALLIETPEGTARVIAGEVVWETLLGD